MGSNLVLVFKPEPIKGLLDGLNVLTKHSSNATMNRIQCECFGFHFVFHKYILFMRTNETPSVFETHKHTHKMSITISKTKTIIITKYLKKGIMLNK